MSNVNATRHGTLGSRTARWLSLHPPSHLVATVSAFALLSLTVVATIAQSAPVQVIQSSDGTLYLVQGTNAWTMVPNAISDVEFASLTASGELDGAIPAPFLSASDVLAPLRVVQLGDGTLFLAQATNVWVLVPLRSATRTCSAQHRRPARWRDLGARSQRTWPRR